MSPYSQGYNDYQEGRPYLPPDNELQALDYLDGYVDAHEEAEPNKDVANIINSRDTQSRGYHDQIV